MFDPHEESRDETTPRGNLRNRPLSKWSNTTESGRKLSSVVRVWTFTEVYQWLSIKTSLLRVEPESGWCMELLPTAVADRSVSNTNRSEEILDGKIWHAALFLRNFCGYLFYTGFLPSEEPSSRPVLQIRRIRKLLHTHQMRWLQTIWDRHI